MSFHHVFVAELVNYRAHNQIVRGLAHDLLTVRKTSNVVTGWLDDWLCYECFPGGNGLSLFWQALQSWNMLEYSTSLALLLLLLLQLLNYYIHCYAVAVWVKHMATAPVVGGWIPHLLTMKAIWSQYNRCKTPQKCVLNSKLMIVGFSSWAQNSFLKVCVPYTYTLN